VDVLNGDSRVLHSSDIAKAAQSVSKIQTVTIKLVATLASIGSYLAEWMMQGFTYRPAVFLMSLPCTVAKLAN